MELSFSTSTQKQTLRVSSVMVASHSILLDSIYIMLALPSLLILYHVGLGCGDAVLYLWSLRFAVICYVCVYLHGKRLKTHNTIRH